MSQLVINFPGCGDVNSSSRGGDTYTVDTQCAPPGPPPIFGAGEIIATVIVSLALIGGLVFWRCTASDNKPKRMEQKRLARQQEIDGQIAMAKAHKTCDFCKGAYEPVLK